MNLQQLTNAELIDRFDKLDHNFKSLLTVHSQKIMEAYLAVGHLPGVQDDANNSRQTIIEYIRDQEEFQQPKSKQRTGGRRRKSIKRRKGRKNRKSRRGKSRR